MKNKMSKRFKKSALITNMAVPRHHNKKPLPGCTVHLLTKKIRQEIGLAYLISQQYKIKQYLLMCLFVFYKDKTKSIPY